MRQTDHVQRVLGVIPARYASSRFPGKPLADINGVPMVVRTYHGAKQSKLLTGLIVATDDERIADACRAHDVPIEFTGSDNVTGSDRVAEVAARSDANFFVDIQGDEPFITGELVDAAIAPLIEYSGEELSRVTCLASDIVTEEELADDSVIKIVTSTSGKALYFSRSKIPHVRNDLSLAAKKQVCVYGFTRDALERFRAHGPALLERTEDIELLRMLELGIDVDIIRVPAGTMSVDSIRDLEVANKRFIDMARQSDS